MSTAAQVRPRSLTEADVEMVRISDIEVGVRRRKSLGGLSSLMKSIEAHGLIHPILLRHGNQLVAGGRRLAACEKLGRQYIAARTVDGMSDEELRAIEEDENSERAGLNDFESSKARLAEIRQAEADQRKAAELSASLASKSERGRGRPTEAVSRRVTAEITGIPDVTQRRIASHVEIAEQYPALQRPGWVQHQVLNAGVLLEKLPVADRPKAAALLDQDAIPPKTALGILENLTEIPAPKRDEIFKQAESGDEFERKTALARAAALPALADPGLVCLHGAVDEMRRAARLCRDEDFKARIKGVADAAAAVLKQFSEKNRKERE